MRGPGAMLLLSGLWAGAADAAGPRLAACFYAPESSAAAGDEPEREAGPARTAFERALAERGAVALALPAEPRPPTVGPDDLAAATAPFRAFHFADAAAALSALAERVESAGGGELDQRQLSELYLVRGMARQELGQEAPAWEDLVRAARFDPGRVLDPAQSPPRILTSYRRAAAQVAQLPHATLEVAVPDGARARVDGRAAVGATGVTFGAHLVRVIAPGYADWGGVVTVQAASERIAPPLRPLAPPDDARLVALAAGVGADQVVLGAVIRGPTGWRFLGRRIDQRTGEAASEEVGLAGKTPEAAAAAVRRVIGSLLDPPAAPNLIVAPGPPPPPPPLWKRWWLWTAVGGGAAVVLAIAIPLGVVYDDASPIGTVGGPLAPLR